MMQRTDYRKVTPQQFNAQWQDYYSNGLGADKNPRFANIFGDNQSKSWKEQQHYLNSLIQPVEDVGTKAQTDSGNDMAQFRQSVADFQARMKAEAHALDNPTPPVFTGEPAKLSRKALEVPGDSLTRVGNFLGGSGNAIQRMAAQRTEFLRQIAQNTRHHGGAAGGSKPTTIAAGILCGSGTTIMPSY